MEIEQIRRVQQAKPFVPYRLHLSDGRAFDVPHPEYLAAAPGSRRTVIVFSADGYADILDAALISQIHLKDPAANSESLGDDSDANTNGS